MSRKEETGASFGNAWAYRTLIKLLAVVDLRVIYVFMYVFVIPPTLLFSPGARIAFDFYHSRRRNGIIKSVWLTYRNHCLFGETVIDKFAMFGGKQFKIVFCGKDVYDSLESKASSFLQLSAHIGCGEILGYSLKTKKKCNILAYGGENESFMQYRQAKFNNSNMMMIPVGAGENHSDIIVKALENGEVICTFADRYINKMKIIESSLFGNAVNFSRGAFSLASTRGLDVVMVTAMKDKYNAYKAFFTLIPYDKTQNKKEQIKQLADGYSKEIERLVNMYPLQWYNYFDLWKY